MTQPPQIHPTESFYRDVDLLREEMGEEALSELAKAVEALAKAPAKPPVAAYGWQGDSFAYPFGGGMLLTFRRVTDRDEAKQPKLIHLYLKRIVRVG